MIFTARQLADLHKSNGHIALPRGARLTPLAQDWLKARKIELVYTDLGNGTAAMPKPTPASVGIPTGGEAAGSKASTHFWWCDGPCGMAKAALSAHREVALTALNTPADSGKVLPAVKELLGQLKADGSAGGLLFVQSAGPATVYLNRSPAARAVVGSNLQSVDLALRTMAANVLVIEYPSQNLQQMKNLIGRFLKAKREISPELQQTLRELAQ